jgi:hypothetical protein
MPAGEITMTPARKLTYLLAFWIMLAASVLIRATLENMP